MCCPVWKISLALINSGNKFTFYVCWWNSNFGTSQKNCVLMLSLITSLSAILKKMTYEKWNTHYTIPCSEKYPNKILPEDHLMILVLIEGVAVRRWIWGKVHSQIPEKVISKLTIYFYRYGYYFLSNLTTEKIQQVVLYLSLWLEPCFVTSGIFCIVGKAGLVQNWNQLNMASNKLITWA